MNKIIEMFSVASTMSFAYAICIILITQTFMSHVSKTYIHGYIHGALLIGIIQFVVLIILIIIKTVGSEEYE